jgi:hypothetical protein
MAIPKAVTCKFMAALVVPMRPLAALSGMTITWGEVGSSSISGCGVGCGD